MFINFFFQAFSFFLLVKKRMEWIDKFCISFSSRPNKWIERNKKNEGRQKLKNESKRDNKKVKKVHFIASITVTKRRDVNSKQFFHAPWLSNLLLPYLPDFSLSFFSSFLLTISFLHTQNESINLYSKIVPSNEAQAMNWLECKNLISVKSWLPGHSTLYPFWKKR